MFTKAQVKKMGKGFHPSQYGTQRKTRKRPIKEIKMKGPVSFLRFIKKIAN